MRITILSKRMTMLSKRSTTRQRRSRHSPRKTRRDSPDTQGVAGALERCGSFCLLPCVLDPITITGCIDEDLTFIPNTAIDGDCVLDPRIEDGYSVAFKPPTQSTPTLPALKVVIYI